MTIQGNILVAGKSELYSFVTWMKVFEQFKYYRACECGGHQLFRLKHPLEQKDFHPQKN